MAWCLEINSTYLSTDVPFRPLNGLSRFAIIEAQNSEMQPHNASQKGENMNIPEDLLKNQVFDSRAIGFNRQLIPNMINGGKHKDTNNKNCDDYT